MRIVVNLMIAGLLLVMAAQPVMAQETAAEYSHSLWIGGHYTDFKDYAKKVGEYRLVTDDPWPEFKILFNAIKGNRTFTFDGYFFDKYNAAAAVEGAVGDRFSGSVGYRSMVHNKGQDLLENLAAQEYKGGPLAPDTSTADPGDTIELGAGKYLTHDITDPGANYREKRHEINSDFSLLLSHKSNLRLVAAHRTIIEKGSEQKLSAMHCFSCHVTSETAKIDRQTHQLQAGLEGEVSKYDFGYMFGYRTFESNSPDNQIFFDTAMHPVFGTARTEFGSREIYQGEVINYGILPETEKMSHKVKFKGDLGKGRFAAAFTYSTVENKKENFAGVTLKSEAYGGSLNYAMSLSKRARLIAKIAGNRIKNDNPFVDLPNFRVDTSEDHRTDFDFVRYSSLDRKEVDASAEVVARLNRKTTLSVLAGYDYTMRYDYPELEDEYTTKKMIGQIKMKYREGMRFTLRGKYRFEKTSDPFTSGRGLFEARGREELQIPHPGFRFVFYYERENLRYQDITTVPTDRHEFELKSTLRPTSKVNVMLGFKTVYDKNGDLDSLDVKNLSFQPNLNVTLTPNEKWSMVTGYTFNYNKSRGPVTIALFDG